MTQLALASDGNHAFAENATDLASIFNHELGDLMSVVAKDVDIDISFDDGVVPVRALNRDVQISGRKAHVNLNQLYASQDKYILFEVKVPPGTAGKSRQLADVAVKYNNLIAKKQNMMRTPVAVKFAAARTEVAQRQNKKVMAAAVEAIATDENRRAVALRDAGKAKEAQRVLEDNARYLEDNAKSLQSKRLEHYSKRNRDDAAKMPAPAAEWRSTRKMMRAEETRNSSNQAWE
jgi:Ca-activated chloride channel family protein